MGFFCNDQVSFFFSDDRMRGKSLFSWYKREDFVTVRADKSPSDTIPLVRSHFLQRAYEKNWTDFTQSR